MSLGRAAGGPPGGLPGNTGRSAGWRSGNSSIRQPGNLLRRFTRATLDDLVTTFFPAECRVCERPLVHAGTVPVCELCIGRLRPQTVLLCRVCGEALGMESERFSESFGPEARLCTPCRRLPPQFSRATAFGVYEGELREMLHLLKYEHIRSLAAPLGAMLANAIALLEQQLPTASDVLVVAVPLFAAKQRSRGFNHAEVLADAAIRSFKRTHPDRKLRPAHAALRRVRETESQFGLTPRARRNNLRAAFAVTHPALVAGHEILLIDDIYTTGATARACAQVLREAGARTVLVATLARAQVEAVAMWDAAEETSQFGDFVVTGGHR